MQPRDMTKMLAEPAERISLDQPIPYATYQRHINRYIFASKFVQNKIVLDIGCGVGAGSKYWVTKGAKKLIGLDISEEAVKDAQTWNKDVSEMGFILADAQALPFRSDSFDIVISLETIEHLKDAERFLLECNRVTKKGGIFICSTPNKRATTPLFKRPGNPYHVKEFYPQEFYDFVRSYFTDVAFYGQHMLNLKNRIKPQVISFASLVLSLIPGGNKVRKFLRRAGRIVLEEPHLPRFREDIIDEVVDKGYEVTCFKEGLFKTPETLIIVAKD